MATLKEIIDQQVTNAFNNVLAPGGLTETVTLRYLLSTGTFNVETDTLETEYLDVPDVVVVAAKPTYQDVTEQNVVFTDTKLIIPGTAVPRDFEVETDSIIRADGTWNIKKTVGVPGRGAFIVYVHQT